MDLPTPVPSLDNQVVFIVEGPAHSSHHIELLGTALKSLKRS